MSTNPESRVGFSLSAFCTFAALLLSAGAVIYSAGIQSAQITENRRRIDKLEQQNDRVSETVQRIDTRTATIEAKLQLLIPDRAMEASR